MEYNILRQDAAASFARAKAAGIGVIARMPVGRGFMSGSIDESYEFSEGDRRKQMFSPENIRTLHGELGHLRDEADKLGISPAATAIWFCVSNPNDSCVLPGFEQLSNRYRTPHLGDRSRSRSSGSCRTDTSGRLTRLPPRHGARHRSWNSAITLEMSGSSRQNRLHAVVASSMLPYTEGRMGIQMVLGGGSTDEETRTCSQRTGHRPGGRSHA